MTAEKSLPLPELWLYPVRFFTVLAVLLWLSRPIFPFESRAR